MTSDDVPEPEEFYPEFATVRRGYDPARVEAVLDDLYSSLETALGDANRRARELSELRRDYDATRMALRTAQQELTDALSSAQDPHEASFAQLGVHVARILEEATAEATDIRARAERDAQRLRSEAERVMAATSDETVRMLAVAEAATATATAEAQNVLDQADHARLEVRTELAAIRGSVAAALNALCVHTDPGATWRSSAPMVLNAQPGDQTASPSVSDDSPNR